MSYRVQVLPGARRQFRGLSLEIQRRLQPQIEALSDDPRPRGAKRLTGLFRTYRVRVGDYRIIYEIQDTDQMVSVTAVGHRREIYR